MRHQGRGQSLHTGNVDDPFVSVAPDIFILIVLLYAREILLFSIHFRGGVRSPHGASLPSSLLKLYSIVCTVDQSFIMTIPLEIDTIRSSCA